MFLSAHFSSLSKAHCMADQHFGVPVTPLTFVSSADVLTKHPAPPSRSRVKILNSTHPSINHHKGPVPAGLCATDHSPLGPAIWPIISPPHTHKFSSQHPWKSCDWKSCVSCVSHRGLRLLLISNGI